MKLVKNWVRCSDKEKSTLEFIVSIILGGIDGIFTNIISASMNSENSKAYDINFKPDKLIKENELLQIKLDNAMSELAKEKEINKSNYNSISRTDIQHCKQIFYIYVNKKFFQFNLYCNIDEIF